MGAIISRFVFEAQASLHQSDFAYKAEIPHTAVGGCVQVLSTKRSVLKISKSVTRKCEDCSSPSYSFASLRSEVNRVDLNRPYTAV